LKSPWWAANSSSLFLLDLAVPSNTPCTWQAANGVLTVGERLVPKRPFTLGGEYNLANLVAMEAVKGMRFRGDLAVQIRDLPDGASITFKIVD
jgi:hypothetical protein